MPDAESFVAAIAANPADDLPRLVYADWLDENGDPARAAFIRDHVRLAKLRPTSDEFKTLFRRCADTLRANLPAWIKPACDAFSQPAAWKTERSKGNEFSVRLGQAHGVALSRLGYTRGFITHAELDLRRVASSTPISLLFTQYPITRLLLSPPGTADEVLRLMPASPLPVRSLRLFGGMNDSILTTVLALPGFGNVTELTVPFALMAGSLVRSPMARRLVALAVNPDIDLVSTLRDYPLDDKLQQFTVLPLPPVPAAVRRLLPARQYQSADELWSAVSRVSFRPTLKRLDLTRCGMTDDGLAAFARGEEGVRLQGLKLGGNLFGDRGWADFCRGWRTPELTYLDASRNRLTDAGAEMLARSGMVRTLRVIDLRGNRIAGRGAVALARAVAEGKLTKLLLAGNPLHKREATTVKGLLGERTDLASGGR